MAISTISAGRVTEAFSKSPMSQASETLFSKSLKEVDALLWGCGIISPDECKLAVDVVDEFATLTQFVAAVPDDEDDDLDGIVSSASDDELILCKLMRPGMAEEFFLQKPLLPDVAMAVVIPHTNEVWLKIFWSFQAFSWSTDIIWQICKWVYNIPIFELLMVTKWNVHLHINYESIFNWISFLMSSSVSFFVFDDDLT